MQRDPGSTPMSLIERLQQTRSGDDDAWWRFFSLYSIYLSDFCRRRWDVSDSQAHDFASNVLLKVRKAIQSFEHPGTEGAFRGWLRTILNNAVLSEYREQARGLRARGGAFPDEHQIRPPAASGMTGSLNEARLLQYLRELCPRIGEETFQLFLNFAVKQRSVHDVAEEAGVSISHVYKSASRVKERLRKELPDPAEWRRLLDEIDESDD